jgi:Ca2+-transporting ATPase
MAPLVGGRSLSHSIEYSSVAKTTSSHHTLHDHVLELEPDNPETGLTNVEVSRRQALYGPNDVTIARKPTHRIMLNSRHHKLTILVSILQSWIDWFSTGLIAKYLEQFRNPLIMLLLLSAGISLALGQLENAISIALAVLLVGTVAFIQEYRTERSLEALNKLAPPRCRALRDGQLVEILATELVPGDVVELRTGDRVPADLRLVNCIELHIDESMLTGEGRSCVKSTNNTLASRESCMEDQMMMDTALMATLVRQGYGRGVVTATGDATRFGRMYALMRDTEERRSPLQCHLDRLGQQLSIYSLGVIAVLAIVGIIQRQPLLQIFTVAVSLAVAAIPEGLPIVATITLALGVLRLARRNVIVRKLPAVESLGSVDVLCVDKTGTLTMNQLTVQTISIIEGDRIITNAAQKDRVMMALALCNNAQKGLDGWHGNAVDVALQIHLEQREGLSQIVGYRRIEEISFTSERKYMAVRLINESTGMETFILKGAAEILLSKDNFPTISAHVEELYGQGLRVIAVAIGSDLSDAKLIGLVGMCDPPRPDMRSTIRRIMDCGVRPIMVTGDARQTATSIGRQIGWPMNDHFCVCSGEELNVRLKQGTAIDNISIVYRATPEHKMHLVDALQRRQHVVAMTGDGVNDAPAMKMSDIGIAMGKSGTDVARNAAQIILTDDRLGSMVEGIHEGKAIFSNIRHFIRFQLSTSLAALAAIAVSMMAGHRNPMNAMQILLVNIIMDGPPAQSLGVEPVDPIALQRPPRPKSAPILSGALLLRTFLTATHIVIGTALVMWWEASLHATDSTRTFSVFVLFSMVNAYTCRSSYRSTLQLGLFTNRFLAASISLSILMLLSIIYIPAGGRIFQTVPLGIWDWIVITTVAGSLFFADEFVKAVFVRPALRNVFFTRQSDESDLPLNIICRE